MRHTLAVLSAVALALGATAWTASADADIPDFDSMPKAATNDFTVREGVAYSVRGFRTPSGAYCTSSNHRGMYALDCYGPFVGAPDGANSVHLFGYADSVTPLKFDAADIDFSKTPQFEGHPLAILPPGTDYAFDNAHCAYTAGYQLACVMAKGANQKGFVATLTDFTVIGQ